MSQRLIKNVIVTGVPFGLFIGIFFSWSYGNYFGVIGGIGCGIFFGISMSLFAESQRRKMISENESFEGEAVLFQGPANHFMKAEGKGGWLTLIDTRLAFRSHGKNIQNKPIDIAISEIVEVKPNLMAGLIPNGLRIYKKDGDKESFVVSNRKDWATKISNQLKAKQKL